MIGLIIRNTSAASAVLVCLLLAVTLPPSEAVYGSYYTAVFDQTSTTVETRPFRDLTTASFWTTYNSQVAAGYSLAHFNPYVKHGGLEVLYNCVYKKGTITPGVNEVIGLNMTYDQYTNKYSPLWTLGFRLKFLQPYFFLGKVTYAAVWRKVSYSGEYQLYGWAYADYRKWYDQKWTEGWRLLIIKPINHPEGVRYYAVFVKSTVGELQLYGWAKADVIKKTAEYAVSNYKVWRIEQYFAGSTPVYTVVYRYGTPTQAVIIAEYDTNFKQTLSKYSNWNCRIINA